MSCIQFHQSKGQWLGNQYISLQISHISYFLHKKHIIFCLGQNIQAQSIRCKFLYSNIGLWDNYKYCLLQFGPLNKLDKYSKRQTRQFLEDKLSIVFHRNKGLEEDKERIFLAVSYIFDCQYMIYMYYQQNQNIQDDSRAHKMIH